MTRIQFWRLASTSLLSLLVISIARPCLATPLPIPSLNRTQVAQANRSTIPVEQDVLAEINRARTNPHAYAEWLETLRPNYDGAILRLPGETPIRTREGVAALDEAIAFLQASQPLSPLQHSDGMSQGAQDLVEALGQSGAVSYQGSDHSLGDRLNRYGRWGGRVSEMTSYGNRTATATVLLLILNDGNAERPLRNALFSSTAQFIGVACGVHETQQTLCTLNYATTYTEGSTSPHSTIGVSEGTEEALSSADADSTSGKTDTSEPDGSLDEVDDGMATSAALPDILTPPPDLNSSPYYISLQTVEYLSPLEREIVAETNRLRENPVAYAEELENLRPYYDGTLLRLPGLPALEMTEGVAALDEAIAALRDTEPLATLAPSRGLSQAAQDHVMDLGGIGATGHYGSDGSTPLERINRYGAVPPGNQVGENISFSPFSLGRWHVIHLVIDDGVPERSHRNALLRREYRLTGVSCGSHSVYGEMCGITYATDYVEQN